MAIKPIVANSFFTNHVLCGRYKATTVPRINAVFPTVSKSTQGFMNTRLLIVYSRYVKYLRGGGIVSVAKPCTAGGGFSNGRLDGRLSVAERYQARGEGQ